MTCEHCGQTFRATRAWQRFCRIQCARQAQRYRNRTTGHVTAMTSRTSDRALVRELLGDRDGWVCWLCGGAVDRRAGPTEPLAPSVDHVIPTSLDGPHTAANVRLAHFACNTRRGNREVVGGGVGRYLLDA
jgi:5-methylcytosine-specific restriction endonuclease McrA